MQMQPRNTQRRQKCRGEKACKRPFKVIEIENSLLMSYIDKGMIIRQFRDRACFYMFKLAFDPDCIKQIRRDKEPVEPCKE